MRSALAALVVLAVASPARADDRYVAKKDRDRAKKSDAKEPAAGVKVKHLLNLHNGWTDETIALDMDATAPVPPALVDGFLRCHFTNEETDMDPKLVKALVAAAKHFGKDRIDIVSGFRHPKYNLILRKKGHEVARDSQHTHGNAVDFRIPGISTEALRDWALGYRMGGVGYYRNSAFVHMDTGAIRTWTGD